jgi:hypothetical protein
MRAPHACLPSWIRLRDIYLHEFGLAASGSGSCVDYVTLCGPTLQFILLVVFL